MYEDSHLDEDYQVESAGNFFNDKNDEELGFIIDYMKPCKNCGELRPKQDIAKYFGLCYLCSKSKFHEKERGNNSIVSDNFLSIEVLLNKWDNQNEY